MAFSSWASASISLTWSMAVSMASVATVSDTLNNSSLWAKIVNVAGQKLEISKCEVVPLIWEHDCDGTGTLVQPQQKSITITCPETGKQEHIVVLTRRTAKKLLHHEPRCWKRIQRANREGEAPYPGGAVGHEREWRIAKRIHG